MNPEVNPAAPGGLDLVKRLFAAGGARRGIGKTMRFRGKSADQGVVVIEGQPDEDFYNPLGTVHGGYAATLLDAAMALAVYTSLPADSGYTTIELKVTYLKPMTADSAPVVAEGRTFHAGRRIVACEGRLTDREGKLCAHATATYLVLRNDTI